MTRAAFNDNPLQKKPARPRTGYRRALVAGLAAFLLLFGGVFGWMAYASISGAVVASGTVVVRGKPKLIQHYDGGIVKDILVENGDIVRAGAVLVRLDKTLLIANLEIYRNRLREAFARMARLEAERDGLDEIVYDDAAGLAAGIIDDSGHRRGQEKLFAARFATRVGQIAQLREKIGQYGNQTAGVNGLIESKMQQLEFVAKELAGLRTLYDKGLASETRVLAQERQRADLQGQLSEHRAELARIDNSIRETEIAILQIDRQFQEAVLSELREVSTQFDDLIQQVVATEKQLERIEIRAPVDGIVHELSVYTVGGVVPPGGTLMQLIAVDQGVELEVSIDPQSIDQLHVGRKALVRFPAFNQRTTPEVFGTVEQISASSIVDEKTGYAFYRVGITVPRDEIARLGALVLVPGMPVEAFIETTSRTVLSFIMKPITDQLHRAFREE